MAAKTVEKTGGIMVHPNQDPTVIAGQGTIGLEVLQQVLVKNVQLCHGQLKYFNANMLLVLAGASCGSHSCTSGRRWHVGRNSCCCEGK